MPADKGMPENDDVRKKALLRLAVAGIVTSAALAGLWWLDRSGGEPKSPVQATSPAPIVAAKPPTVEAPEIDEPIGETESPETDLDAVVQDPAAAMEVPGEPLMQPSMAPPPPPKVSNSPRSAPPPIHMPPPPRGDASPPPPRPTSSQPPAAEPAPRVEPPSGKGYVVQLGVFSNPDNARELVDKLARAGVRAHLEARVQLGPFQNREEAEKARLEMRKLGYNALLTLPYSATPAR
jgi:DedD protein